VTASAPKHGIRRRALLGAAASALAMLCIEQRASAEDIPVPVGLQIDLLAKVVLYDRNFAARVRDRVQVLILTRSGDAGSERTARHLEAAFERVGKLGPFPVDYTTTEFRDPSSLSKRCRERSIDVVYLTPEFDAELSQIVPALTGLDLLSVSVNPVHVPERVVLGFDLVSGKPKLLVHLDQARLQNVAFRSDLLKLARVYP
jgi:hypothetical protein